MEFKILNEAIEKAKKVSTKEECLLLSFSGHDMSSNAKQFAKNEFKVDKIIKIDIPNIDPTQVVRESEKILAEAITEHPEIWEALSLGNFYYIPPGMSPLAIVLLTMINAISGHFPLFTFSLRKDGEFVLAEAIDLHELRLKIRNLR